MLDLSPVQRPIFAEAQSIDDRFVAFDRQNPHIYRNLVALTWRMYRAGRRKVGIAALFERLRWEYDETTSGDHYRLNNDYRSRYVRLIQQREPMLASMFNTSELRSA